MYDAKLRLPPHLYSVTPVPSKTRTSGTTANIDASSSDHTQLFSSCRRLFHVSVALTRKLLGRNVLLM